MKQYRRREAGKGRQRGPSLVLPGLGNAEKVRERVRSRVAQGLAVAPRGRLRVYQTGRAIDGQRTVVSVYEHVDASQRQSPNKVLDVDVYTQKECRTHTLRVGRTDVERALGKDRGAELLEASRRLELCEALVQRLRFLRTDGAWSLLLMSHDSFGSPASTMLAERRALQGRLERLALRKAPEPDSAGIPKSPELEATLESLATAAHALGKSFPNLEAAKRPVGALLAQDGTGSQEVQACFTQEDRIQQESDDSSEHADDADENEDTTSLPSEDCEGAPLATLRQTLQLGDGISVVAETRPGLNLVSVRMGTDNGGYDVSFAIHPVLRMRIAMDLARVGACSAHTRATLRKWLDECRFSRVERYE